jgi:hypothetical protein
MRLVANLPTMPQRLRPSRSCHNPAMGYRVTITERRETNETGEPPQDRELVWFGDAADHSTAEEAAWAEFAAKYGTTDRPPAEVNVVDELEQYRVPETGSLESAARRYIVGKVSRDELVARAEATEAGGQDDELLTVVFANTADQSTAEGLKAGLRRHFESS